MQIFKKFPTPVELELRWKQAERSWVSVLASKNPYLIFVAAIFLMLPPIFYRRLGESWFLSDAGGMILIHLDRFMVAGCILVSLLNLFVGLRYKTAWLILSFHLVWSYSCYRIYHRVFGSGTFLLAWLSLPLVSLLTYTAMRWIPRQSQHRFLWTAFYLLASGLVTGALSYFLYQGGNYDLLRWQWLLNPTLIVFTAVVIIFSPDAKLSPQDFAWSQVHIFRGTPLPVDSLRVDVDVVEKRRLWWLGSINLTCGYFELFLRILLDRAAGDKFNRDDMSLFPAVPYYIVVVLTNIGYLNLLTGVLRISGFKVPDATDFKWLARSPAEFWRRGNVYVYTYVLSYVYFPALRLTKRPLFSSVISMTALFFFKVGWLGLVGMVFYFIGSPFPKDVVRPGIIELRVIRWLLWAVATLGTRRWYFRHRGSFSGQKAWILILGTHVIMIFIYWISYALRRLI